MLGSTKQQWKDAFQLAWMQFLVYGIATVSMKAVVQANIPMAIMWSAVSLELYLESCCSKFSSYRKEALDRVSSSC